MSKKSYHLVLSGGGIRGMAHIGMVKALLKHGYVIDSISGTSAGALVGLFIAAGKTIEEMEQIIEEQSGFSGVFNLIQSLFSQYSLFNSKIIEKIIKENIPYMNLEDLPISLRVCVTDIDTGVVLYYTSGPIKEIIIASCSIPGIFKPVVYDGHHLVDGGLRDDLPIPANCELPIIGCHVNPLGTKRALTMQTVAVKALKILVSNTVIEQQKKCEIFLEPPKLNTIEQFLFINFKKIIQIGYKYADKELSQI